MKHTTSQTGSATRLPDAGRLPLSGIRVVEVSHMVMGPSCGLFLADLGAEVIKVEPTGTGDKTRYLTRSGAGYFPTYSRNKKSLSVDIHSDAGREVMMRLLGTADVFLENFRPGAMERGGYGPEALREAFPGLVYASHKGFLDGPYGQRTALDEVVQMMGGMAFMTGLPDRPMRAGASVNDVMGGLFGALAIVAALYRRDAGGTGEGVAIASGLFETCAFLMGQHVVQAATEKVALRPMSMRTPAWSLYDIFATCDDARVFVAAVTDGQWRAFAAAFGLDGLAAREDLATNNARVAAREWLIPEIAKVIATRTKADVLAEMERIGLPFAEVRSPEALPDDPHLLASGGLVDVTIRSGETARVPGMPISLDGQRLGHGGRMSTVGGDGAEILVGLGYDSGEIAGLADGGTVTLS